MTFDRDKKGYNSAQVDDYIARLNEEHYREAGDLRHRIDELKAELDEKNKRVAELESRREAIATALINAVEKANEIERAAVKRYRDEMDQLRVFHGKWQAHYNALLARYPDDEGLKAQSKFNEAMDEILSDDEAGEVFAGVYESEKKRVKPKAASLAENSVSASGFDFAEAWNPTEDLGSIMSELGLMDDDNNEKQE